LKISSNSSPPLNRAARQSRSRLLYDRPGKNLAEENLETAAIRKFV
jgi:hypothetical protein